MYVLVAKEGCAEFRLAAVQFTRAMEQVLTCASTRYVHIVCFVLLMRVLSA